MRVDGVSWQPLKEVRQHDRRSKKEPPPGYQMTFKPQPQTQETGVRPQDSTYIKHLRGGSVSPY